MGELESISETTPSFIISEEASDEQRQSLSEFYSRILQNPDLYQAELSQYAIFVSSERAKRLTASEQVGSIIQHLLESDTVPKIFALSDYSEYFHGNKGLAKNLKSFDNTTEADIKSDTEVTRLTKKLKETKAGDRGLFETTFILRKAKMGHLLGRVSMLKARLNTEADAEMNKQNDIQLQESA